MRTRPSYGSAVSPRNPLQGYFWLSLGKMTAPDCMRHNSPRAFGRPTDSVHVSWYPLAALEPGFSSSAERIKARRRSEHLPHQPAFKVSNSHSPIFSCHEAHFNHHSSPGTLFRRVSRRRSLRHHVRQCPRLPFHRCLLQRSERPAHEGIHYFWFTSLVP
jgi:hypothetical protein